MSTATLKRQFIQDAVGNPIGVILPLEEYKRIAPLLGDQTFSDQDTAMLKQIEYAARDPLFLADLRETMAAYEAVDAQWWEPEE